MHEQEPTPSPEQIDVNAAFDPIERQAQAQMDIYAENRPKLDGNGVAHDPATGEVINPDAYFDEQREIAREEGQTKYEDMPIPALAHKLGEAEYNDDRTTQDSVTEVLLDKIGAEEARIANEVVPETQAARQNDLWDSVMAAKELKKRQLEKKNGKKTNETEAVDETVEGSGGRDSGKKDQTKEKSENSPETDNDSSEFDKVLDEDPEQLRKDLKNAERMPSDHMFHARGKQVTWGPDKYGMVQKGFEFRGQKLHKVREADEYGRIHIRMMPEVISWDETPYMQGENREVILRAFDRENGTNYTAYIHGDKMYEIVTENYDSERQRVNVIDLSDEELPNMAIGRSLAWADNKGLKLWSVDVKSPSEKVPMYRNLEDREMRELKKGATPEDDKEWLSRNIGGEKQRYNDRLLEARIDVAARNEAQATGKEFKDIDRDRLGKELEEVRGVGIDRTSETKEWLQTSHEPRGNDPFEKIKAQIDGNPGNNNGSTDYVPDWVFYNGKKSEPEQKTRVMNPTKSHETGHQNGNIAEQISKFSERFADKTYVPTPAEYEHMRELAGRIKVDYGGKDGKRPIKYLSADGYQLNAKAARDFLDRVNPGKWMLKDREAKVADDLYEHATPINIGRLDLPQRGRRNWLSYGQFVDQKIVRNDTLTNEELVEQYRQYLSKRIELSDTLTRRQAAEAAQRSEIVLPEDLTMDALKSFRANVRGELRQDARSRRRNAASRVRNAVRRARS